MSVREKSRRNVSALVMTDRRTEQAHIRATVDELYEIDCRAKSLGLSRSEYMLRAALGQPMNTQTTDEKLAELESRLERMEKLPIF